MSSHDPQRPLDHQAGEQADALAAFAALPDLTLADIDADGALEASIGELHGHSRATFLRGAVLGSAGLLAAALAPPAFAQGPSRKRDASILNYALVLEYLQDSFYREVDRIGLLSGGLERQAQVVSAHEAAHVAAFRKTLGSKAVKRPRFDFRGATESSAAFRKTAVAFEDLAVAAYKGQAPRIDSKAYLGPALAIHAVEARHAAWIRKLAGISPVLGPFDEPRSRDSTMRIVAGTNFVVARKTRTRSNRRPSLTG